MCETTTAGSLPEPGWRAGAQGRWPRWLVDGDALARAVRDATRAWIGAQAGAGRGLTGDGGQRTRIDRAGLACRQRHEPPAPMALVSLPKGKGVRVGGIDVAGEPVETPGEVAGAIGRARVPERFA